MAVVVALLWVASELSAAQAPQSSLPLAPVRQVSGRAFYEKVPVTSEGLDPTRRAVVPIRHAQVEVFSRLTGQVVFRTGTDMQGRFGVRVPTESLYAVRVLSRSVSVGVVVADNTDQGRIYSVESEVFGNAEMTLVALDSTRVSGAFNILEVLRQGNTFLERIEPAIELPVLTVFWSPENRRVSGDPLHGEIGSTFFDVSRSSAFVLGDRATDSDEFDDAVLLHEYAHLLAQKFSRDDSIGGPHVPGDVLDPRVAWSEGWANFFSGLVRNDPIYRDSFGRQGASILEYDLEDNLPVDPGMGYWGEVSVHRILWDLFDSIQEPGDSVALGPTSIWRAFRRLAGKRFVYLPHFLDELSRVVPSEISAIEQTARAHFLDYVHSADPPVLNPFPKLVSRGVVTGELDSWSRERANLAQSAHLYTFDTTGGAVSIELDITGLGPAGNRSANDLDLFLMDSEQRIVARSDRGLNGAGEWILAFLPAGTYVIEIRSFYLPESSSEWRFNSGAYRLTLFGP